MDVVNVFSSIMVVGCSGALGAMLTHVFNRGKTKAETDNFVASAQHTIIEDLRTQMSSLGSRVDAFMAKEVSYLGMIESLNKTNTMQAEQIATLSEEHKKCAENEKRLNSNIKELRREISEAKIK